MGFFPQRAGSVPVVETTNQPDHDKGNMAKTKQAAKAAKQDKQSAKSGHERAQEALERVNAQLPPESIYAPTAAPDSPAAELEPKMVFPKK